MNKETKLKIIRDLTEDKAKSLIETYDLPDDSFEEVEAFLDKCFNALETMVENS